MHLMLKPNSCHTRPRMVSRSQIRKWRMWPWVRDSMNRKPLMRDERPPGRLFFNTASPTVAKAFFSKLSSVSAVRSTNRAGPSSPADQALGNFAKARPSWPSFYSLPRSSSGVVSQEQKSQLVNIFALKSISYSNRTSLISRRLTLRWRMWPNFTALPCSSSGMVPWKQKSQMVNIFAWFMTHTAETLF